MSKKKKIYENLVSILRTGDVFMNDTKGFLPDSIDTFQKSTDNHSGLIIKNDRLGEISTSEAIGRGVTRRSLRHYILNKKKKYRSISFYRLNSRYTKKKYYEDVIELQTILHEGQTGYDFMNLLFFQLVRFAWYNIFGKKIWIGGGEKKGEKRFICGEWVAYCINKATNLFDKWWQDAPVDVEKSGYFVKIAEIKFNKNGDIASFYKK